MSREYEQLTLERLEGGVALVRLNRPKQLNALCAQLIGEICDAFDELERDHDIGAVVLTGSDKAFAAGVDITELAQQNYAEMMVTNDFPRRWNELHRFRKPLIAAVGGYALGGGCELAMMCDFIIAADNAKFGQPEITIGVLPGLGGSQRLTRLVGKSKAMDMCLTGRMMDAEEAERSGLASRVLPVESYLDEAIKAARKIASYSQAAALLTKEAVNTALETSLEQGVRAERLMFLSAFSLEDQKEGMQAFVEKRQAEWKNR